MKALLLMASEKKPKRKAKEEETEE
jgi:hypothetical protein